MEQGIAAGDASLLLSATEEERVEGPEEQFQSCVLGSDPSCRVAGAHGTRSRRLLAAHRPFLPQTCSLICSSLGRSTQWFQWYRDHPFESVISNTVPVALH